MSITAVALLVSAGVGYFAGREIERLLVALANRSLQRDLADAEIENQPYGQTVSAVDSTSA